MSRIDLVDPNTVTGEAKSVLDEINAAFGTTPAMFKAVAHSPAALTSAARPAPLPRR